MSGATAVVVGLDVGGTKTNATVLDEHGRFLVDRMVEVPSRVREGPRPRSPRPRKRWSSPSRSTGTHVSAVRAVGLDTPGTGECGRCDLGPRRHELRRTGVVALRLPSAVEQRCDCR